MKIGMLIRKPESIFSNGCIQQSYFLRKLLINCGYTVDFLSIEYDYSKFEISNDEIIFTDNNFNFSDYNLIILSSLVLLEQNNGEYINNLCKYNIPIINMICGNLFVLLQEEFVFNVHHIVHHYTQKYITENWIMEMYDYSLDFTNMLTQKPSHLIPYTWNPDIISTYVREKQLFVTNLERNTEKVNLLLFEPNMSIHKNSFVPLIIANDYYVKHKDNIHKIYVFCGDKIISNENNNFIKNLEIYQDKKLEVYSRIIMPYIVDTINKNNNFLNITLSYTHLNRLNFLHLEMLYLGIPIIHNCEDFKENGLYFNDYEQSTAIELINYVKKNFNKEEYRSKCNKIISKFSYDNVERIEKYKELIDSKYSRQIIKNNKRASFHEDAVLNLMDIKRFKLGEGYVFFIRNTHDADYIEMHLQSLLKNTCNIEIIYKDDNMEFVKFSFNPSINIHHTKLSNILTESQINSLDFDETVIKHISKYNICYYIENIK
tara:strand:+ start:5448 stop:6911 length:1464 start_codon:yes stop_codon:yes gene_type:complete